MMYSRLITLCSLAIAPLLAANSWAANSVLIWPIDPTIASDAKATELWLENRGDATTLMQVRAFLWQQSNGKDQYQTQQQIQASPPMVRIEPGKKQLIRLVKQTPPAPGQESAYRILLDEIPSPQPAKPDENRSGLNFQMRYSVPLFVYGNGASAKASKPVLSWRLVNVDGKQALQINNTGNVHARLSHVTLGGRSVASSLLGYVLAHSSQTFPLSIAASGSEELSAELGENEIWRSRSTSR